MRLPWLIALGRAAASDATTMTCNKYFKTLGCALPLGLVPNHDQKLETCPLTSCKKTCCMEPEICAHLPAFTCPEGSAQDNGLKMCAPSDGQSALDACLENCCTPITSCAEQVDLAEVNGWRCQLKHGVKLEDKCTGPSCEAKCCIPMCFQEVTSNDACHGQKVLAPKADTKEVACVDTVTGEVIPCIDACCAYTCIDFWALPNSGCAARTITKDVPYIGHYQCDPDADADSPENCQKQCCQSTTCEHHTCPVGLHKKLSILDGDKDAFENTRCSNNVRDQIFLSCDHLCCAVTCEQLLIEGSCPELDKAVVNGTVCYDPTWPVHKQPTDPKNPICQEKCCPKTAVFKAKITDGFGLLLPDATVNPGAVCLMFGAFITSFVLGWKTVMCAHRSAGRSEEKPDRVPGDIETPGFDKP